MDFSQNMKHRIEVAMGKTPADITFKNARVVSTFTEEIWETSVSIADGRVVSLDDNLEAKQEIDLQGKYLAPSFIDAHIHIESSMLSPEGFAETVVPHGTGAVISDPHEIVNVLGIDGYKYMYQAAQNLPMDIHFSIPSCVPATHMETSGAQITAEDFKEIYKYNNATPALSELMNYPGVYFCDEDVLNKVATAHKLGLSIDGHSPMLKGRELNAYLNAGIFTDHECTTAEEATEKLRKGMHVLMREGSAARNLEALIPVLSDHTAHRICIASDDRHPDQLMENGHLNLILKMLIDAGVDPIRAIRIMTLNPATVYNLKWLGGIGIGYYANFVVLNDLQTVNIEEVYYRGQKVTKQKQVINKIERIDAQSTYDSVHIPSDLKEKLNAYPTSGKVNAIKILPGELITQKQIVDLDNKEEDVCYLAVVERHGKNSQVGLGYVVGMGLSSGALASTVAHDNHNLILVGKSIDDMITASQTIQEIGGGFAVVDNGKTLSQLPLKIAGLMSDAPVDEVVKNLHEIEKRAQDIGTELKSPFMVLSFLALAVIPHIKLTDCGLVDVDKFAIIDLVTE
ncbi:adenine deaminase [Candidatus Uabimicrobium helgolandensis]